MKKKLMFVLGLLVIVSMILSACAPKATTTPGATEEPAVTAAPTEPPTTRHGGWFDEIDYSIVDADSAVTQVEAGAIDLYSFGLASPKLADIKAAGLSYASFYGTYFSILFNPAVFTDTTKLNPFSDRKIREAVNWLIDRNYINQEIYGGGSLPKYTALTTQLVDYTGVIDTARGVEAYYAYNPDKAKEVIAAEMESLGATLGADGKWQFGGQPVSVAFLIRNDGDGTRLPQGDYVANQLESVGFTVDRQYKKSSEAGPIWIGSDPADGQWNLYTAGWGSPGLTRDEKDSFQQMYLPTSIQGMALFLANVPDPAFQTAGDDLSDGNFTTLAERQEKFEQALPLSLQDSLQVWTIDSLQYAPYQNNVSVTYDVGAGVESASMAPYAMRFKDQEGGQMKIGTNDLFTEPWNTVGGSNWVWDTAIMQATQAGNAGLMPDPYTGLRWPLRIETAEVTAQTGLPVGTNLGWVDLKTADTITVPDDAFVDWDPVAQKFITAVEKFPDGTTSKIKSVVTYPSDLYDTVKWHDGSSISAADFVMAAIMTFDRAYPDSPIYDESYVPNFESFMGTFKGFKITSTDPLTIEYYSDLYYSDAELDVTTLWPSSPYGLQGENSWQIFAISNAAEAAGELAYTPDKAEANTVEQTSWVGGPSLDILSKHLDEAIAGSTIPYAPTMGEYITADEAATRYTNLKAWYTEHGHFWVGTGPYFLDSVDLNAKSAVAKNNPDFPDLADRWAGFGEPKLADATLDGSAQVKIGDEAVFNLTVTLKNGDAYPSSDIREIKFLIYNDQGETVYVGAGESTGEGTFTLTVPADVTSKLVAGTGSIEAAAVLVPVAIPAFTTLDYVVVP